MRQPLLTHPSLEGKVHCRLTCCHLQATVVTAVLPTTARKLCATASKSRTSLGLSFPLRKLDVLGRAWRGEDNGDLSQGLWRPQLFSHQLWHQSETGQERPELWSLHNLQHLYEVAPNDHVHGRSVLACGHCFRTSPAPLGRCHSARTQNEMLPRWLESCPERNLLPPRAEGMLGMGAGWS